MSPVVSHYPISQRLHEIIQELGLSRFEFVQSLGYRKYPQKGLGRLEAWLDNAEGYGLILKQIEAKYPVQAAGLQEAVAETKKVKSAEAEAAFLEQCRAEQETFEPYIHVQGETTVPNGITLFGLTGGRSNLIEVPRTICDQPMEDQLTALSDLMHAYLREYKGACPFFGRVTGFRYVRCLDYLQFDAEGRFVETVGKPFRRGSGSASLS